MSGVRRPVAVAVVAVVATFTWLSPRSAGAQVLPAHLSWAETLVNNITPENNSYSGSPTVVTWNGVGGARRYQNRTYCATFLTALMKQGYGFTTDDIEDWLGSPSPSAAVYFDAIDDGNGFRRVLRVEDIRAGDIVAISYPTITDGLSGHVVIARRAPRRLTAASPLVPGTTQYELAIVDSTSTPHGTGDTRTRGDGAGFGLIRVYADGSRNVAGYTWSTAAGSVYYSTSLRPIMVGRFSGPRISIELSAVSTDEDSADSQDEDGEES